MNTITKLVLAGFLAIGFANADSFKTTSGNLEITPINHASTELSWNNINILLDPVGSKDRYKNSDSIDLILITDIHGDHLNAKTINSLMTDKTQLIAPQAVINKLPDNLKNMAIRLDNKKTVTTLGVKIESIAMYNLPESKTAKHVKGRGNGYVLTFADKRVYFSGDTADIKEMRELKDIDIAFVTMNLPYTMSINAAASGVNAFKPKIVYPYHYRGKKDGKKVYSDIKEFKKLVNKMDKDITVELRNWYN
ncbi:MAG: MBL fold metallo-hydrolase [Campylobacteraceae bacterium]|nr:MBL fold metallo-hydrolase [Campylobacteraceae bacterium]